MSWARIFNDLWKADWSATDIAEGYGTTEERVRTLIALIWIEDGLVDIDED